MFSRAVRPRKPILGAKVTVNFAETYDGEKVAGDFVFRGEDGDYWKLKSKMDGKTYLVDSTFIKESDVEYSRTKKQIRTMAVQAYRRRI